MRPTVFRDRMTAAGRCLDGSGMWMLVLRCGSDGQFHVCESRGTKTPLRYQRGSTHETFNEARRAYRAHFFRLSKENTNAD